ncbi:MAG: YncE family protein, partial [Gaiellales bacterium]
MTTALEDGSPSDPLGTVVDAAAGKVYWIEYYTAAVHMVDLDGTHQRALPTPGAPSSKALSLTLDPTTGTLYWANISDNSIVYAKTDGSGGGVLYSSRNLDGGYIGNPSQVAVDPARNLIYWANGDWRSRHLAGPIVYANLDGSGSPGAITPTGAHCSDLTIVSAVQVDSARNTLYLFGSGDAAGTGTLQKMALDGTGCSDLATGLYGKYTGSDRPYAMLFGGALDPQRNRLIFPEYGTDASGAWPPGPSRMSYIELDNPAGPQLFSTGSATMGPAGAVFPTLLAAPVIDVAAAVIPNDATTGQTITCGGTWSVGIP